MNCRRALPRLLIALLATLAAAADPAAASARTDPRLDEAARLEARATALGKDGKDSAADSLWQQALAIRSGIDPRDDDAIALAGLGDTRRRMRRFADADSLTRLGLDRLATAARPDPALGSSLHEIRANLFAERRDPESSLAEVERAFSLHAAIVPPDSIGFARLLAVRGRAFVGAGRLAEALRDLQTAAAMQERLLGPVSADLGETLYRIGFAASQSGDYLLGTRAAERSLSIREQVFGPDHLLVAVSSMGLAGSRRDLGDNAGALAAYARAEAILRRIDPPNPAALATVLSNKGSVYLILGDGTKARACYEETIALRDRVFGAGRGEDLFAAARMAQALLLEGDAAAARERIERALAKSPRIDPLVTPEALGMHASVTYRLGDRAAARASLERSHAITDSLSGPGSPRTLETLGRLAALDLADGRRQDAYRRAWEIEERGRNYLAQVADALSEREALEWSAIRETGLTVLVALAADSIGLAPAERRAVLDAVIRSRVLVLDRRAEERNAMNFGDPALVPLARELEAARADLARLLVAAVNDGQADSLALAAARRRREDAERALGAASTSYRGAGLRVDDGVAEIAAALRPGWALVSFVRMTPPAIEQVDLSARVPEAARYTAFVLRADDEAPRVIALGTAGRIEPAVQRWVAALATRPATGTAAASERRAATLGRAVRRAAWEPLAAALAGVDTVAWVPDGALHRMDLAALPAEAEGAYLVESGPLVVRLTAERDLVSPPAPPRVPEARGLLALGSVDFDAVPGEPGASLLAGGVPPAEDASLVRDAGLVRFTPLPATAVEVEAIARTWRTDSPGTPVQVHLGAGAREDIVKRDAPNARVLHLATHAFALGIADTAGLVAGALARGVGGVTTDASEFGTSAAIAVPRLPGLALAGANRSASAGGEDGFLTAEEISGMDLRGVEWAVLSACATGVADPAAVEAVQGLHRAFRRAGVETVIMSLWSVDDAATAAWMDALYSARLERGLATAPAVRAAHRAVLAGRRKAGESTHPFWWAAFVASGRAR